MRSWALVHPDSLPREGERVLLMNIFDLDIRVATLKRDRSERPAELYWDVEHDQQYAIYDPHWTHWTRLHLPTGRILGLLQKSVAQDRTFRG